MKLETSFRMVATAGLALVVWSFGCDTRTPIGEVPDAGQGDDGALGDGAGGPGTGGVIGTAGGTGGSTGTGGRLASGGDPGRGGRAGAGGTVGGPGGTTGTAVCQSYTNSAGAAGHSGDVCNQLTYPASGFYGDNILAGDCTTFSSSAYYEIGVMGPTALPTVQVTLTSLSVSGARWDGDLGWNYTLDGDWRAKEIDAERRQQLFQTRALPNNETMIKFFGTGAARVDIYDCDLNIPTRSKIISWTPAPP